MWVWEAERLGTVGGTMGELGDAQSVIANWDAKNHPTVTQSERSYADESTHHQCMEWVESEATVVDVGY